MPTLCVTIPGEPKGQGRGRAAVRNGKAFVYSPKGSSEWRASAQWWMKKAMSESTDPEVCDSPCTVKIIALFARPKKLCGKKVFTGRIPCAKKPDCDNVLKIILDASCGPILKDDALVWRSDVTKLYCSMDETPEVQAVFEW